MEIYTSGRGQGKTLKAIQLSAEKQTNGIYKI